MIADQTFHCPHCGAPGQIKSGLAEYSCQCRFGAMFRPQTPAPIEGPTLTPVRAFYDCGCPGNAPCDGTCCPRSARPSSQVTVKVDVKVDDANI